MHLAPQPIPSQRHLFELDDGISYLNCAQTSPFLISVKEAGHSGIKNRTHPWHITAHEFFRETEAVRKLFGALVEGNSEHVALIPSASYGMATAVANIPVKQGENIIVLEGEFPSNYYACKHLADKYGGTIRTVNQPADFDWTRAILNATDEKTAMVGVPNCHWTDGSLVDLVALRKAYGEKSAPALVIDATQSLGAYPLAVDDIKPDFLVAVTYKWLMGPYTFGMLYVDEKHLSGEPIEHNWINRKGSEDFSRLVDYRDEYQPGARRYDMGERANAILEPMTIAALEQILHWGVGNINHTIRSMTDRLADEAPSVGLSAVPKAFRAGHMIGLRSEKPWQDAMKQELLDKRIYVSFRGSCMRVAPHVYNTMDDIERLLDVLKKHCR